MSNAANQALLTEMQWARQEVASRPGADMTAVDAYLRLWPQAAQQHDQQIRASHRRALNAGVVADPRFLRAQGNAMQRDFNAQFMQQELPRHSLTAQKTFREFTNAVQPKNIFEPVIKMFWDSNKGEPQWLGIAGGIAGLFAANSMIPAGEGILGVISVGLGMWMGAKLGNIISGSLPSLSSPSARGTMFPVTNAPPIPQQSQSVTVKPQEQAAAMGMQHVDEGARGTLPSPSTPAVPPPGAGPTAPPYPAGGRTGP